MSITVRRGRGYPTRLSEEVRVRPVSPVLPVVALVVRLRPDQKVPRIDAQAVVAAVPDDPVAKISRPLHLKAVFEVPMCRITTAPNVGAGRTLTVGNVSLVVRRM